MEANACYGCIKCPLRLEKQQYAQIHSSKYMSYYFYVGIQ